MEVLTSLRVRAGVCLHPYVSFVYILWEIYKSKARDSGETWLSLSWVLKSKLIWEMLWLSTITWGKVIRLRNSCSTPQHSRLVSTRLIQAFYWSRLLHRGQVLACEVIKMHRRVTVVSERRLRTLWSKIIHSVDAFSIKQLINCWIVV